ncbi:Crp/Fnr family transcriptional regulator [Bacillus sp. PS06]|uniref:Crp/Fnr family transcriptional regulator n=1 Tax=Bacillus sp. PS06 TaxID=2764176 RepID=UPI001783C027|nr:Crp/Fnr family transcriptional regulator [Bacillus sp. PS06]MBD8069815.1 Crp/Fnr family transcriptional regulator [Bacillus sp. PS06]
MDESKQACSHHGNKVSCVNKVPIFNTLSVREMEHIEGLAYPKKFGKDDVLFIEGEVLDKLLIIHTGKVKINEILESGEEHILRILSPGEFIGEYSLFEARECTGNIEALEATEVCVIEQRHVQELVELYPVIALKLLKELSQRLKKTEELVSILQMPKAEQRIATVLLQQWREEQGRFSLDIRKADLANIIGLTPESLSRKLSKFQKEGWIEMKGQREIMIKNKDAIQKVSEAYCRSLV